MKLISIIVPCYNVAPYIDRCLTSLVGQTIGVENLEIILVNDASTDDTYEKLCQWEKSYEESVMVINCQENGKQGAARNIGMIYASGEYLGFVDADDWIEPDMYEKLYHAIKEYDADLSVCKYKRDRGEKEISMGRYGEDEYYRIDSVTDRRQLMYRGMGSGIVCKLYRKSLLLDNELYFPENIHYEDNYWSRVLVQYVRSIVYVKEYLYHYFVNMNSTTTSTDQCYHYLDRMNIEEMLLKKYIDEGWINEYFDDVEEHFIRLYYINTLHILFTRFQAIPATLIPQMQNRVKQLFPDYRNNPILSVPGYISDLSMILYDSLEYELTPQTIAALREKYLAFIRENHVFQGIIE